VVVVNVIYLRCLTSLPHVIPRTPMPVRYSSTHQQKTPRTRAGHKQQGVSRCHVYRPLQDLCRLGQPKNYARTEFGSMNALESNLSARTLCQLGTERRSNQDHADRQDVRFVRSNLALPKRSNSPIEGSQFPRGRQWCTPRAGAIRCLHECQ
jgi:hypothetical protein